MPNVLISGHIAGSIGDEVTRMADYIIEEFQVWQEGRPLRYAVSLQQLETMA
jgi:phosphoglycerate dehydrogenase-like enzyme